MNEDDTFNKLRRTPYDELARLYCLWVWSFVHHGAGRMEHFLEQHNWTLDELVKEQDRRDND